MPGADEPHVGVAGGAGCQGSGPGHAAPGTCSALWESLALDGLHATAAISALAVE